MYNVSAGRIDAASSSIRTLEVERKDRNNDGLDKEYFPTILNSAC